MHIWSDVRLAVRLLWKDRGFTMAAVVVLALGIAATNTVFTLVNGVLLRDLPFDEPDRIVQLGNVSYPDFYDWRAAARSFEGIGLTDERTVNIADDDTAAERFRGAYVSSNSFALLRVRPMLGRDFRADEDRVGAVPVVILGHHVWRTLYQSDAGIVGRTVRVNGTPSEVIGVMPEGFEFPLNSRLWQPVAQLPEAERNNRQARFLDAFGRLRDGVTITQAHAELTGIAASLARTYPNPDGDIAPRVESFRSGIGQPIVAVMTAMMGAVFFVLLIACANVANLLLARATRRTREVSVRLSLGATRGRIVRQLLAESLVLATVAGVFALALSAAAIRLFWYVATNVADPPPFWMRVPFDPAVFVFLGSLCLGTSIMFGLAPALQTARTNLLEVLNEAGRGSTGHRRSRRWSGVLVTGQLALTLVLLTGAGLMMRNLLNMVRAEAGVETASLVRMAMDLPGTVYASPDQRRSFYRQLDERLASLPNIRATLASAMPMSNTPEDAVSFEGRPEPPADRRPVASLVSVGPRYFQTLGASILTGRGFTPQEDATVTRPAVVNQRFVDIYFGGQSPVGRRIRLGAENEQVTIVGVAANVRQRTTPTGAFDAVVYRPFELNPPSRAIVLARSTADIGTIATAIREQVRALDADLAIYDIRTVDEHLAMGRWGQRVFGSIFAIFAAIALVLAIVGLYAVTAQSIGQRTKEIGVRVALGARASQVWWLVTRQASAQLIAGLLIGGAGAAAASRVLPAALAGTSGADPLTMAGLAGVMLTVGLAACFIPARHAMRLDPVDALRDE
jgi:predicted permease